MRFVLLLLVPALAHAELSPEQREKPKLGRSCLQTEIPLTGDLMLSGLFDGAIACGDAGQPISTSPPLLHYRMDLVENLITSARPPAPRSRSAGRPPSHPSDTSSPPRPAGK